ncbi:arginine--tRNA ligase [Peribacillus sp. SCS-37]|uniref:arginine--tRNA ligase n=1 Tax=Paraperibacillus esterisolvens TaxID=3115296 RepID=UPI003905C49B
MEHYQNKVAEEIEKIMGGSLSVSEISRLLETPKHTEHGDLAFPCFQLAKKLKKSPASIAEELAPELQGEFIEKAIASGPYINFFLNQESVMDEVLALICEQGPRFGDLSIGQGSLVPIDMSSPNIAKPFSMGHLRSTVIGNSIANLMEKCGYAPVRINHLGDWGTQFGKLITAYKLWGDEEKVRKDTIRELLKLYVKFHDEAEKDPSLEEKGREWFKKLEEGHPEAISLWQWFRDESLEEFNKIYELLNVKFDSTNGEAFYNDKMAEAVQLIEERKLLVEDNGAMVVKLDEEGLPPSLIKKSDGATLYVTRDLAAAIYRQRTYKFEKAVYVVGNEQSLHFRQLKLVLKKLGFGWADGMVHVPFGMILKDGKKMSTRKGKVVLLEEVLADSIQLAQQNILEKNPHLENKQEVARQVGTGAVIFHDLRNERMNNIEFSLEDMLKFEGETGPYLQYTHARAKSILRKAEMEMEQVPSQGTGSPLAWQTVKELAAFPAVIDRAYTRLEPSVISKYLIDLAQAFNSYYGNTRILISDQGLASRLMLVEAVTIVLKEGLRLLGIEAPDEM